MVLGLADPNGAPLPPFAAGAHIDVQIRPGLSRQYSLCGLPSQSNIYQIGVLKDPASRGGGAIAMHERRVGDKVTISEPRNHFSLISGSHQTVLFAGGIGITPMLFMAKQLVAEGADFELHYCARSIEQAAFKDELSSSDYVHRVFMHFDNGPDTQRLNIETLLSHVSPAAHIYICGPGGFINWISEAALKASFHVAQIHREFFKANAPLDDLLQASFEIKIASTNQILPVPVDQSVLSILHQHGFQVPVSCTAVVCGTCLTRILEGIPDHRDFYSNDEEKNRRDCFLPCCSRSSTPLLVLDYKRSTGPVIIRFSSKINMNLGSILLPASLLYGMFRLKKIKVWSGK